MLRTRHGLLGVCVTRAPAVPLLAAALDEGVSAAALPVALVDATA